MIKLSLAIFLSTSAPGAGQSATMPDWLPVKPISRSWEVKLDEPHRGGTRVRILHKETRQQMYISVEASDVTSLPPPIKQVLVGGIADFASAPSATPIGREDRVDQQKGRWRDIHVYADGYLVRSLLNVSVRTAEGKVAPSNADHSADEALQDGLLRGTMARLAGLTAKDAKTISYAGSEVPTVKVRGNNLPIYQIGESTAALGITASMDYSSYILTLQKGNRIVVVPLGTTRIIVNGTPRDLADVSAEVGDKPFIQIEVLSALLG